MPGHCEWPQFGGPLSNPRLLTHISNRRFKFSMSKSKFQVFPQNLPSCSSPCWSQFSGPRPSFTASSVNPALLLCYHLTSAVSSWNMAKPTNWFSDPSLTWSAHSRNSDLHSESGCCCAQSHPVSCLTQRKSTWPPSPWLCIVWFVCPQHVLSTSSLQHTLTSGPWHLLSLLPRMFLFIVGCCMTNTISLWVPSV